MASKPEIISEIEALSVHCRPPLMEASQRTSWLLDWCSDLSEFPLEAIRTACRKYRLSGATKFPTPGQLIPEVRAALPFEKGEKAICWKPATEDEYRSMSVRDKLREQLILAHEARCKAGPMYRNTTPPGSAFARASGVRLTAEELSPAWRQWTTVAEQHELEASKLRKILRQPYAESA